MELNKLLKLQLSYSLIGILFNLVSWGMILKTNQALTPTVPIEGIMAMSIYALFLLTGHFKLIRSYRLLMVLAMLILGYGGIVKNLLLLNQSPELYYSLLVGLLGISINLYGFVLNGLAALGKFRVGE